jgi:hypothetical protein
VLQAAPSFVASQAGDLPQSWWRNDAWRAGFDRYFHAPLSTSHTRLPTR